MQILNLKARSANQQLLRVPKTKHKLGGVHAFAVAAPKLWNDLPLHIRQTSSLSEFKALLKTDLFAEAFGTFYGVDFIFSNSLFLTCLIVFSVCAICICTALCEP